MATNFTVLTHGDDACDPTKHHFVQLTTYLKSDDPDDTLRTTKWASLLCQQCGLVIEVVAARGLQTDAS